MAPRRAIDRADAERSFEQLYRGHHRDVYRAALRELGNVHDAEDVTQAAFVDAYRAVLRGTQPQAPRAWLLTIAENVRRRRFRTSLRRPREEPLDADAALAAEESSEQAGALLEALANLTDEQRETFLLREISGLSYDEIAERTGSTVASVQMLLFRARKTLRKELEPPQVHGVLVPLATLFSRFEAVNLSPRVAVAVGATVLAVGVSASQPAKADPPPTKAAQPQVTRVAPAPAPVAAAKPNSARRPVTARAVVVARPAVRPVAAPVRPTRPPAPQPRQAPSAGPESARATPPAPILASPSVPTPSVPLPPVVLPSVPLPSVPLPSSLEPLVEPLLEGAGAAGAAGASAPPLPVLPPVSLPPVP